MDRRQVPDRNQRGAENVGTGSRLSQRVSAVRRDSRPASVAHARTVPLGRAESILLTLVEALNIARCTERVELAGGVRRFEPLVDDLAIVVVAPRADEIVRALRSLSACQHVRRTGPHQALVTVRGEMVSVDITARETFGLAMLYSTGSREHVRQLEGHARQSGWRLSREELGRQSRSEAATVDTEASVYESIGLPYVEPELRHGNDEVEAAAENRLPALVRLEDIRGDLHLHTDRSDGRDPLERMVQAARALGYEYVAITDHSPGSAATRVLSEHDLEQQALDIEELRRSIPGITILRGAEVDILPDGRLDFADTLLAKLDFVLASLHDPAGHPGTRLTERYLRAAAHPLVNVLTHLTNRIVGRDDGYQLDFDAIFRAARETGTMLEVDGAPIHLDMDGPLAREAVEAGVIVSISSDCHRAEALGRQMRFGVGTARRGWIGAASVLNTRSLDAVRGAVAFKRARGA